MHYIAFFLLAITTFTCSLSSRTVCHAQPLLPNPNPIAWTYLLLLDTTFGLDSRPSNTTCIAPPRVTTGTIELATPYPTLPLFSQPTKILQAPGDDTIWFVLEKGGLVKIFDNALGATTAPVWLDISTKVNTVSEGGLLGMAFHPSWPAVKQIYLSYTGPGTPMISYLSRFIISNDTVLPVSWTEEILLTVNQDFNNHNGGDIAFGPDGFLYLGLGDGGSGGDPNGRAQDTTRLLGSFLRIHVLGVTYPAPGYTIPLGNPFSGNALCGPGVNANDCPEIYAWGFRNPWRWSFDSVTNALWVGDVGQNLWEEVDIVQQGGNYGWDCREGAHDYEPLNCSGVPGLIDPVAEYDHTLGNSITGGFVYHGTALADSLSGQYVFGDFGTGRIWTLSDNGEGGYVVDELLDTVYNIVAFGEDQAGELYVVHFGGTIYKITPAGAPTPDNVPETLSATGCFSTVDPTQPAAGLIPYDINAPFWSDGAEKARYLALPDGTTITIGVDGDWMFPPGSVIVKNFTLGGLLIETRLLMRHPDGVWAGYTYEWNAGETLATRVRTGKVRTVNGQDWIYPSESQCMDCHTAAAGFALGPETAQLNKDFTYPSTGRTANQLATMEHIGLFSAPLPGSPETLPALTDPTNISASLEARARSYLHTNCSQCHRPAGPTPSSMDVRYDTPFGNTNTCNIVPEDGDLGIVNARIIAPGDAGRSVLVGRMNRRDISGMPPLGSTRVDSEGVLLISGWIDSLAGCP